MEEIAGNDAPFAEVERLVRSFEACSLPRERWNHAAHLTVACWYLLSFPREDATARMRAGIRRYNDANGIPMTRDGGYHDTLTIFWMRILSHHLETADRDRPAIDRLRRAVAAHAEKRMPLEYYSRDRILSPAAREGWVEPDLRPLPGSAAPPPALPRFAEPGMPR